MRGEAANREPKIYFAKFSTPMSSANAEMGPSLNVCIKETVVWAVILL